MRNRFSRSSDDEAVKGTQGAGTLDDRTVEALLAGRAVESEPALSAFVADVQALRTAPAPSVALAAMLAGGLHGIEHELPLEDELVGNAYTSDRPKVPRTLAAARDAFASSTVARAALGDAVVDHYTNMADVELAAFNAAVTDWELFRGFERL